MAQTQPNKIGVGCLIYASIPLLKKVKESFDKWNSQGWDFWFCANDPTDEVLQYLKDNNLPHIVHRNPEAPYKTVHEQMRAVYRAWSHFGFFLANKYDTFCFVNSDFIFSEGWQEGLLKYFNLGGCVVNSWLVESNIMPSLPGLMRRNFGQTLETLDEQKFLDFAKIIRNENFFEGGAYMPCLISSKVWTESGGVPIGNRIESDGRITSGDRIFAHEHLKSIGIVWITSMESIVYHTIMGEQRETNTIPKERMHGII